MLALPDMPDLIGRASDLSVEHVGAVAIVEIRRPPNNFFDAELIGAIADHYEALARSSDCRAIVLAAEGKSFCAGASLRGDGEGGAISPVSKQAVRLFRTPLPVIAAVNGAATGGGMGLALSADFRVGGPDTRFWPNFSQLGFHAGFGLSVTLPRLVGAQRAELLLYTGRRIKAEEAASVGLIDLLVAQDDVRAAAIALATEIAAAAPLAVQSMRQTMRRGLADRVEIVMERELLQQSLQRSTEDFKEGVAAMRERRPPSFAGR
jgi:enoyl-CoA hydratase/carnithine racemase